MKKPRDKKYKGPINRMNPLTMFSAMNSAAHAEYTVEMRTKTAASMANIMQGRGDKGAWDLLVGFVNVAKVLSGMGIGPEFHNTFHDAGEALLEMGVRSVSTSRFVFTGPELKVMQEAISCHDAQLENIRAIDIDRALRQVEQRLRNKANNQSVAKELATRGAMREAA